MPKRASEIIIILPCLRHVKLMLRDVKWLLQISIAGNGGRICNQIFLILKSGLFHYTMMCFILLLQEWCLKWLSLSSRDRKQKKSTLSRWSSQEQAPVNTGHRHTLQLEGLCWLEFRSPNILVFKCRIPENHLIGIIYQQIIEKWHIH